jgi:hypothetical protein
MFFSEEIEKYDKEYIFLKIFCYVKIKIARSALDLEAVDCKMQACYWNNYPSGAGPV